MSAKTIKWRIQSIFSGQSFGEIVLKNSLVYQVTEVYLIHSVSGLLLAHVSQNEGANPDGDMISGMLTAIRDFVGDSFKVDKSDSLETIRVGEYNVIMEQGPHAILACVVLGEISMELRSIINDTIEESHKEFGPELKSFSGDTSNISDLKLILNKFLITKLDEDSKPGKSKMKWVLFLLSFLLALYIGNRVYWGIQWKKLKTSIESANYEIIQSGRKGRNFTMLNLDATGFGIDSIIDTCRIPRNRLKIMIVESASNSFEKTEKQISRILENDLNISVKVEIHDGNPTFNIHGSSSADRVNQLINWLPFFCEGFNLSFEDLISEELVELRNMKNDIENILLFFYSGSVRLIPNQDYTIVMLNELLKRMDKLCGKLNVSWKPDVSGSTDEIGNRRENILLEERRAYYVVDNLLDKNLEYIFVSMATSLNQKISNLDSEFLIIKKLHPEHEVNKGLIQHARDQVLAYEELKKSASLALELNKIKEQFISIISHDLRSPFISIISALDFLFEDPHFTDPIEEEHREFLDYIHEDSKRVLDYLEKLLDWTRLDTGKLQPVLQIVEFQNLMKLSHTQFEQRLKDKEIILELDIEEGFSFEADPTLFSQVINNLIGNAIKFTPRKGLILITGTSINNGAGKEIRIIDNGIGIPPDKLSSLFREYEKHYTYGTEGEKGSGFGLSITKKILDVHNYSISCISKLEKGTEFIIVL